jgi:hypothetical protein
MVLSYLSLTNSKYRYLNVTNQPLIAFVAATWLLTVRRGNPEFRSPADQADQELTGPPPRR